jgi:ABC-2 type transport system permease protein
MEDVVAEGRGAALGVLIPANFDETVGELTAAGLEGYVASWADPSDVESALNAFEEQFSAGLDRPVRVAVENVIHPDLETNGQPGTVALTLVIATTLITIIVVPHLVIEEKENKTMDLLLVSPASTNQVVLGKALAGFVYGLTASTVVLLVNPRMVDNWWLVALTILVGVVFAVALGLLLGLLFDNLENLNFWTGLLFLLLIMPLILVNFTSPKWPESIQILFTWMPTVAMSQIVRASFSDHVDLGFLLRNLTVLVTFSILLFGLIIFRVRRLNR